MFSLPPATAPVKAGKATRVSLTDIPLQVPARQAARFIRQAAYVAVYVTTGPGGAADILDVSKGRVLRMLRRRAVVWLAEVFGTVIVGRPEPVKPCCIHMAILLNP